MRVAVIILNYNSFLDCKKCASFLEKQKGVELELVLVDNCSSDGSDLEKFCRERGYTFIASKENRGYNAGNNVGLRYAADKRYKYALVANPDMEFPQEYFIHDLVQVMEREEDVVVCGGNIVGLEGNRQSPKRFTTYFEEAFWFFAALKKLFFAKTSFLLPPVNQYCSILMGSCILVRVSFISQIGFFDENVFLFCEEPILGKQVMAVGKKMYYLHDVRAVHAHVEHEKGSFVRRHEIYWKSRWYYLTHYSGYNRLQLAFMRFSKVFLYLYKKMVFKIANIR